MVVFVLAFDIVECAGETSWWRTGIKSCSLTISIFTMFYRSVCFHTWFTAFYFLIWWNFKIYFLYIFVWFLHCAFMAKINLRTFPCHSDSLYFMTLYFGKKAKNKVRFRLFFPLIFEKKKFMIKIIAFLEDTLKKSSFIKQTVKLGKAFMRVKGLNFENHKKVKRGHIISYNIFNS